MTKQKYLVTNINDPNFTKAVEFEEYGMSNACESYLEVYNSTPTRQNELYTVLVKDDRGQIYKCIMECEIIYDYKLKDMQKWE